MATAYKAKVGGSEFEIPEIEDGLYPANIKDVKEREGRDFESGDPFPQLIVEWELDDEVDDKGKPITLAQFIRIPDGLVNDGILNENSRLHELLGALGYDVSEDAEIEVDPDDWQGREARILVENKKIQSGKNAGQVRPRISSVKPKAKAATKAAQNPRRKPQQDESEDF